MVCKLTEPRLANSKFMELTGDSGYSVPPVYLFCGFLVVIDTQSLLFTPVSCPLPCVTCAPPDIISADSEPTCALRSIAPAAVGSGAKYDDGIKYKVTAAVVTVAFVDNTNVVPLVIELSVALAGIPLKAGVPLPATNQPVVSPVVSETVRFADALVVAPPVRCT